jgi:uncharacterized protein (TIGR03083 family)
VVVDVGAYLAVRARIEVVVRAGDAESPVPSCPGWRVRDVVAHLAGLCEDWADHRVDGYASESWTSTQVSRFSQNSLDEILDRWRWAMTRFVALDDDPVMGAPAKWAFGDAVCHEADIRGALHAGRVPHDAVLLALKPAISRWRHVLRDAKTPTLLLRAPDTRDWWLGEQDDVNAVVVEVSGYEVFRALAGRRSEFQVRKWDWSANPEPFMAAGLPYPFHWSTVDIVD